MWLIDKLFNRKIEGESSLDNLEPLADKVEYEGDKVKFNGDVQVEGLTSKGIANTGGLANIGDVAISGKLDVSGSIKSAKNWSLDLSDLLTCDFPLNISFAEVMVQNNVMFIAIAGSAQNNTEASASKAVNVSFTIPEEYGEKISTIAGNKLTATTTEYESICALSGTGSLYKYGSVSSLFADWYKAVEPNSCRLAIQLGSLGAGVTKYFQVRGFIIL